MCARQRDYFWRWQLSATYAPQRSAHSTGILADNQNPAHDRPVFLGIDDIEQPLHIAITSATSRYARACTQRCIRGSLLRRI